MTRAVLRSRALFPDELIGHVAEHDGAWHWEAVDDTVDLGPFASEAEAEQGLRDHADERISERIVAGAFIAALAAHPVLYLASTLG